MIRCWFGFHRYVVIGPFQWACNRCGMRSDRGGAS